MKKTVHIFCMLMPFAVCLSGCTAMNTGSASGLDTEDEILESRVEERLETERDIRNSMVQVDVEYGFATIYGPKPPRHVLAKIISIVENTSGIKGVETEF